MDNQSDSVDLGQIYAALRRGWRWMVLGPALGAGVAIMAIAFLKPAYEGRASVLLRSGNANSIGALSQLGGLAEMVPFGGGMGGLGSGVETEVKLLTSRTVLGRVVDDLGLQVEIVDPDGRAASELFAQHRFDADLPSGEFEFSRDGGGYRVEGPGVATRIEPGHPFRLGGATLTLRGPKELPSAFVIRLHDREEAITSLGKKLATDDVGDVVELSFQASDPRTAAEVPNRIIAEYLLRRRSTDRGVNQHRYEFLTAKADSLTAQLRVAEEALRQHQEVSGVIDPELSARSGGERLMEVKAAWEALDVDIRALERVLAQSGSNHVLAQRVAAYPTFLKNQAINDVLGRLLEQQTRRTELLAKRTERDPEVLALTATIEQLESQLNSLSRDYLTGLQRQQRELSRQLLAYQGAMGSLPKSAETSFRLEREVKRLSETLLAVQTQAVQARLAAMGEGGDVRSVDAAVPPRKPVFPMPAVFLIIGVFGGAVVGAMGALGREYLGDSIQTPRQVELASGLAGVVLQPGAPLYLGGIAGARGVLVVPIGRGARAAEVAGRIVNTSTLQGFEVGLLDLTGEHARGKLLTAGAAVTPTTIAKSATNQPNAIESGAVRNAATEMEERYPTVVIATRGVEDPSTTALLSDGRVVVLVMRTGSVGRSELRQTVEALARLGVKTAGVVLHSGTNDGDTRA